MTRKELAVKYFYDGYNCSQSVVLSFSDILSLDKHTLLTLSSPFGGGISRLRETCGAVSGMCIVIGLLFGYDDISNKQEKIRVYDLTQKLVKKFENRIGAISCRDIMKIDHKHDSPIPSDRNKDFYANRPCANCIGTAAEILEEYLNEIRK